MKKTKKLALLFMAFQIMRIWKWKGTIALSYPLGLGLRATVKLSAAFFHDESSKAIGGYKSAIVPVEKQIMFDKNLVINT